MVTGASFVSLLTDAINELDVLNVYIYVGYRTMYCNIGLCRYVIAFQL